LIFSHGYEYKKLIRSGGFARVYVASSVRHGYDVAVKQFHPFAQLGEHFVAKCLVNELKIATAVKHDNLMSALQVERTHAEAFIVMKYCNRGSVSDPLL